jgi:D-alanyl-D-alanine carboxypeptidase (penicillin-binding protein 5/6)
MIACGDARVAHRSRRRARWVAVGALVLVLLAVTVLRRVATEGTPRVLIRRTLAAYVRFPGSSPVLAWPREGQAAVEVEGVGGVASSGQLTPVPIASVAKVMTAYLTLLEHPLAPGEQGFTMTITPANVEEEEQRVALGESTLSVRAGERITERQALQALLLPSANNVAALLAVHDAGTVAAFVARMNASARRLGMASTTYTDPSGFDPSTVSTAADQLKLARAAMEEPAFAAIVDEPAAELPVVGTVTNYDSLVGADGYVGVKTGSDPAAGGCLVFAKEVKIGGRQATVLGAVLGQREGGWIEAALISAQRLGDSVAAALRVETVLPAGTNVLSASNADGRRTTAATARALRLIGWGGLTLHVQVRVRPAASSLRAGEVVATVLIRGADTARTGAVARRSLGRPSFGWRLRHLL